MRQAVIIDAVRTPMGRGKAGGALSGVHPADLLAQTFKTLVKRTDLDPGSVDDVMVGCVTQIGEQSGVPGRMAWLAAGYPDYVPAITLDRRCGSAQQAADFAAQSIMAGANDIVIAGGVESMSRVQAGSNRAGKDPFGQGVAERYKPGLVHQGVSAELIAQRWGFSRADLDAYAARSHHRAAQAQAEGWFEHEIATVRTETAVVCEDETIRPSTTIEGLGALAPSFASPEMSERFPEIAWSVTAGNSSQITDGASAMLIMSEERARELNLKPRARFVSFAVRGDDPLLMLTAPIPATRLALKRAGLSIGDIDHFEVNEAFASVPLAWLKETGADPEKTNPCGGAISLGHPLGATGGRLMATMLNALERSGGRYGLQTMCEAAGMANATIIERL
ncbi:MAG: acetyl-CoA C-acyltransferase [Hyphomonadaceae bacterium]